MNSGYKAYDHAKQVVKKFIPKPLFNFFINGFHLVESLIANIMYLWPARGMKVIGVTGTNGKTTTANLVGAILEADGHKVGINSTAVLQIGKKRWDNDLALTTANPFQLQKLLKDMRTAKCDWVVMEVASHSLVQHRALGVKFQAAVMTNLTRDHLDYHGTMHNYAAAKGKLFAQAKRLKILNRDDKWYEFFSHYETEETVDYGTHLESDCRIKAATLSLKGTKLDLIIGGKALAVDLKLLGQFNAMNAVAAAAAAYGLGIETKTIKKGLESVTSVPGRVELINEGQDYTVIIDHAHTTDALENLLKAIHILLKGRLITVIGADGDRDPGKRAPLGRIAAQNSQAVIVTDQEPYTEDPDQVRKAVLEGVKSVEHGVVHFDIPDREKAISKALSLAKKGDVVLIPGLGNQLTRGVKEGKMAWDDRQVTRDVLKTLVSKSQS